MDLKQTKLTRSEWDSIEVPVSLEEQQILKMMIDGYSNIHIKTNRTMSMISFLKIDKSVELDTFLYIQYFQPLLKNIFNKYGTALFDDHTLSPPPTITTIFKIKSIDNLRIINLESNIEKYRENIYEFVLLDYVQQLFRNIYKKSSRYSFYLYTLFQLRKATILHVNSIVKKYVDDLIDYVNEHTNINQIIERAYDFIENNPNLLKYADKELFSHQRKLYSSFSLLSNENFVPKMILYIAPTGTGKTLSPLGLLNEYRVIFVCMARHIGLALAKSAISMQRKIAFAFGCETASDIRLHNYSASTFTKNKKSGGIAKIDNSDGILVELMICDVKSYTVAMNYMLAFHSATRLIFYWDEPTITLDYKEHELHADIHRNWKENKIPNIVFSCATLPHESEIMPVLMDFREKFGSDGSDIDIQTITSYDCKKSIPILTKEGVCAMPHSMYSEYSDLMQCVQQCESNKTLLRYFDLSEIVKFVFYVNKSGFIPDGLATDDYFQHIRDITMDSMKLYYLEVLKRIPEVHWSTIYKHCMSTVKNKFAKPSQGILITTEDAYTLSDGPTIFLCDEVSKIGNFYIQQSKIPTEIFQSVLQKISKNNELSSAIERLEKKIEDIESKFSSGKEETNGGGGGGGGSSKKGKKKSSFNEKKSERNPELLQLYNEIDTLRKQVHYLAMDPKYIPNTRPHQKQWAPLPDGNTYFENAYVGKIDETTVKEVMSLNIEMHLKVLLLLGIGMFIQDVHPTYLEMMKTLAMQQDLFMIIASSDYIYGTNYNFCHGFIGKDMTNMTCQKTLQCMGRIGRGNTQQSYTIRFRENDMIYKLFKPSDTNIEAENMCKLFCSE